MCHLGYLNAGRPVVLPMVHARVGETLYIHGSTGSSPMLAAKASTGLPVCVTVTVVVGTAHLVEDPQLKMAVLQALVDHVVPGRAADSRLPDTRELAATGVLGLDLVEVSAKVRAGGPVDGPADTALPHWAGTVPLRLAAGAPIPAGDLDPAIPTPAYLASYLT